MRARLLSLVLGAMVLAATLAWFAAGSPGRAQSEQTTLAGILSWALSTPENRVTVGAVDGALSSDATIRDLRIADKNGVWLTLNSARISWSRTALFSRRLEIDALQIDRLEVARRPVAEGTDKAQAAEAPALPQLPLKIIVRDFSLNELVLGQGVVGPAARISAKGAATLGKPSEGLLLKVSARRLDAPGTFDVNLSYVPKTTQFDLAANLDEPAGGLLSTIIALPGTPPIALKIQGSGPLDHWSSTLTFVSGPTVGANGRATLTREGDIRVLGLDLQARIEGLLPPYAAPAFAGTTQLSGGIVFGDDGGFAVRNFDIASQTARLTASGYVNAQRQIDITLAVRAVPTEGNATQAGATRIGKLVVDARAAGTLDAPRVTATLAAADIAAPAGSLGSADGRFVVEASPGSDTLSRLSLDLSLKGLRPADPALARAVGETVTVSAHGALGSDLVLNAEEARVETSTARASWTGRVGRRVLEGTAAVTLPDLSAFSGLLGRDLAGAADLSARVSGDPGRYAEQATVSGALTDAGIGIPQVDRLLAGRVAISGGLRRLPDGLGFDRLGLAGQHLSAQIDGAAGQASDLALVLDIPDLARADPRLSGQARGTAHVGGDMARPDLDAALTLAHATSMGRSIPELRIGLAARDVTGNLDARVEISGRSGKDAVSGAARVTRSGDTYGVDGLDLAVGSARLSGALQVAPGPLASGSLALVAPDLDVLTPFALTKLAGDIDARLTLAASGNRQDAEITARGARLAIAGQSLRRLEAKASVKDAWNRPVVDASVAIDEAVLGGQTFSTVRLDSKGSADASDFSARARGLGLDFDMTGRVRPGPPLAVEVKTLSATRGRQRIALAKPATLTLEKGAVTLAGVEVAAGAGRLTASGRVGSTLDLTVDARAMPLSIADLIAPDLGLEGTLDGHLALAGAAAAPTGDYRLTIARLSSRAAKQAAIPAADVKASGRLDGRRATVDASVSAPRVGTLTLTGSAPLGASGALDLRVRGPLDLGVVNTLIAAQGEQVTGRIQVDLSVAGTVQKPALSGSATLTGGSFTDALQGIKLQNIEARLAGRGDVLTIESFRAGTPNGGTLTASGKVGVDPATGFPADLRLTGRNAQLLSTPFIEAVANLDLTLSGPLARSPRVGGRVDVISMNVNIAERLPVRLEPLPNTRHVRPGPAAEARLRLAREAARAHTGTSPFVVAFDLDVEARNRIFVRGRGLEAELGGGLQLRGTSRDPVAIGGFDLRRGNITLAGQRIDLVRGKLAFTGNLSPSIDFLAQTQAADITAQIAVTGTAAQPAFTISSQPALPQDEVISRLLFGRATGGLTGFQALQIAETLAQLTGDGGAFDSLRRALGVDSLDVTTGASGGPSLGIARNLGRRLRVGVSAGATAADTGLQADFDVNRHIKLRGQVGANGAASGGVTAEWEY